MFDGYNISISQFINECREIQNAFSPQEEVNVVILLRDKLRGRAQLTTESSASLLANNSRII